MQKISFASDNTAAVHPRVMDAVLKANKGYAKPYGDDEHTIKAKRLVKEQFGCDPDIYFVYNGTASNCICAKSCLKSYEAVITSDKSHIAVDECGAFENLSGSKVLMTESKDGKLTTEEIAAYLDFKGSIHQVQPKLISLTQPTELGAVYTIDEIAKLCDFAKSHDIYVHIDGARIANACVSKETELRAMITDTGVDILSLGISKNGGMFGDAIVVLNDSIKTGFEYLIKHSLNLHSKARYISAQFIEFFKDGLFYENAKKANDMTKLFYELLDRAGVDFLIKPEANSMFVHLKKEIHDAMSEKYYFYNLHDDICRIMTSYETNTQDIHMFAKELSGSMST